MKTRASLAFAPTLAVLLVGCATDSHRTNPAPADRPVRLAFITCARDAKSFEPVKRGT